jgi:hypothetical protein
LLPNLDPYFPAACTPFTTPSTAITVTLRFNVPSYGVLPSHIAVVAAGLQSQLGTELGSQSAVSDSQALATTGTSTSVTLTMEFDLVASQFLPLSTVDYKCEATCAVRAMVETAAVITQAQQATLFGNTSRIEVRSSLIACDCNAFASQRSGSQGESTLCGCCPPHTDGRVLQPLTPAPRVTAQCCTLPWALQPVPSSLSSLSLSS